MPKQWIFKMPDDLDRRFRMEIGRRKGYRRGALVESICEAVENWIDQE